MSEIRYSLELKYSDEDGCYLGRCPEIAPFVNMGGAVAHGDTWEEAARETEVAVRNVLSYLIKNGTDIPLPLKYEATFPRATVADKGFSPDWSELEAARESLREHMALVQAARRNAMSKLDVEGLQDAIDEINASILQVQSYKNEHPELKLGFYEGGVGSLLNAYREGDLSFDECAERLITRATVAAALRELRSVWQRRKNAVEDAVMEIALRDVLDELDATIIKLGLADEVEKEKCT